MALAGLLAVCGCKQEKAAPRQAADPVADHAARSAEQALTAAARVPAQTRFRGVSVFSQARPGRVAVCGQVNPFADDAAIFVPFVSIVTFGGQPGGPQQDQFDTLVGVSTTEAGRVYAAIVADCWAGGGPSDSPLRGLAPIPPLPDAMPDPASVRPAPAAGAAPAPGAHSATGEVTVRQGANLHSDPHGPAIRTVARGTALHVFAQAPGGWFQVGDAAPWGWMHESMLDRP